MYDVLVFNGFNDSPLTYNLYLQAYFNLIKALSDLESRPFHRPYIIGIKRDSLQKCCIKVLFTETAEKRLSAFSESFK